MAIDVKKYASTLCRTHPILPLVYSDALSYLEVLSQVTNKLNEIIDAVNASTSDVLEQAKNYTDDKIREQEEEIAEALAEVNAVKAELSIRYNDFVQLVNARLGISDAKIDGLAETIEADIQAVNKRTDDAIEQNNEYILNYLSDFLGNIKVTNYFTGNRVTVQDMFDYLSALHAEGGLTYTELVSKNKTYNQLYAYGMSYTELVTHGDSIIV